jgi:sortase A
MAAMTLDVAHAEWAGGGPGYALVRLTGAARGATARSRCAAPTLLIADGATWRRFAPVPGTPLVASGAPFAVAFEIPLHLAVDEAAQWWLEPGPALADDARLDALSARVAALGDELAALRARTEDDDGASPPPPTVDAERDAPQRPAATGPPEGAAPVPRRTRLRALRPGLPALLVAAGALAVGDAVATVAWQEPVSALWASHQQHALEDDLQRLDAAYASPAAAAAVAPRSATVSRTAAAQARMRALAQTLDDRTGRGKPLGELRIPHLDSHYVIVAGTNSASLRRGPGHYDGTALPGQPGTVGIAGHRTTYGAPFRHLDALRRGDPITITMPYGTFTYRVEGTRIVKPSDVSALQPAGRQRLALTACHPLYSAAERLVVLARLTSATPRGAAAGATPSGAAGAARAPRA